jgi:5-methylcytosine-specific restriction endonuclease McrA
MLSRDTLKGMTDDKLIASLKTLVAKRARLTAELLCLIAEAEERKLHLVAAHGSMFRFCVTGLGLSEPMAYKHIAVARAARKYEAILTLIQAGRLHLSTVVPLIPHLAADNCAELLEAAAGQSKRQVEKLIAQRFPKADAPALVRKLPEVTEALGCHSPCQLDDSQLSLSVASPEASVASGADEADPDPGEAQSRTVAAAAEPSSCRDDVRDHVQPAKQPHPPQPDQGGSSLASLAAWSPGERSRATPTGTGSSCLPTAEPARVAAGSTAAATAPAQRPRIEPLAAARYKVQFTASEQLVGKLHQAQELLRRQVPDGDPAVICEKALDLLIESLLKKRFALPGRKAKVAARRQPGGDRGSAPADGSISSGVESVAAAEPDIAAEREVSRGRARAGRTPRSRYIPASVRRQVAERDGLRCTYVGPDGNRCEGRDVEFHHLTPFARGGQHRVDEITLRCRAHNAFQAEQDFGEEHVARRIRQQRARGRQRRAEHQGPRAGVGGASASGTVQAPEEIR